MKLRPFLTPFVALIVSCAEVSAMPSYPRTTVPFLASSPNVPSLTRPPGVDEPGDCGMATHSRKAAAQWTVTKLAAKLAPALDASRFKMLAVCVDFPDRPHVATASEFDSLLFDGGFWSVAEYYSEQSYGKLTIVPGDRSLFGSKLTPSHIGWVRAPHPLTYYTTDATGKGTCGMGAYPRNTQGLFEDVTAILDSAMDFSAFDNNGDRFVDGIVLIHAGRGFEFTNNPTDIWSHKWGATPRLRDGVYLSAYCVVPEYWSKPGDMTVGVFAHEIGHIIGLPDLYDTDGSSKGLGNWSLMATGSWCGAVGSTPAGLGGWEKVKLGFAAVKYAVGNQTAVRIRSIDSTDTVMMIYAGVPTRSYALVDRQHEGHDVAIPGYGLVIERWDATQWGNNYEWYPGHEKTGNYLVQIVQRDARWDLDRNRNFGDPNDVYAVGSFTDSTSPSSRWYDGSKTPVSVTNLRWDGPDAIMDVASCNCPHQGDVDGDSLMTIIDATRIVDIAFSGADDIQDGGCPTSRADVNCDYAVDVFDVITIIEVVFDGGRPRNPCEVHT